MKERISVGVVFGAQSNEHEVSLKSAYAILEAIDVSKYEVHKIGITRQGKWFCFRGENKEILNDVWYQNPKNEPICVDFLRKTLLARGSELRLDAVFPIMHGEYGEDGRVQSLFELLGIPLVGVSSASAVLCMDKGISKAVATRELIPVVPYISVRRGEYDIKELKEQIPPRCELFVKPARSGSSVGISKISCVSELEGALEIALDVCDEALIEKGIRGRECEVAVLCDGEKTVVSDVGEISYKASFYDYNTKYNSRGVKYKIPAKIPEECRNLCQKYAKELFCALGVRSMARVDFFVSEDGAVYFNEVNAIPGFTRGSMYPMLMRHAGYPLKELIDALIHSALC